MNRYTKSKIYMIYNDVSDKCYIGSTTQTLKTRFSQHKSIWRRQRNNCERSSIIFEESQEATKIKLLEECSCENKRSLHERERYWIKYFEEKSVNKFIPLRTSKEYEQDSKEKINKRKRQYYKENKDKLRAKDRIYEEQNREKIKERKRKYYLANKERINQRCLKYKQRHPDVYVKRIQCICGVEYTKSNKAQHEKTESHIQFCDQLKNKNKISMNTIDEE